MHLTTVIVSIFYNHTCSHWNIKVSLNTMNCSPFWNCWWWNCKNRQALCLYYCCSDDIILGFIISYVHEANLKWYNIILPSEICARKILYVSTSQLWHQFLTQFLGNMFNILFNIRFILINRPQRESQSCSSNTEVAYILLIIRKTFTMEL